MRAPQKEEERITTRDEGRMLVGYIRSLARKMDTRGRFNKRPVEDRLRSKKEERVMRRKKEGEIEYVRTVD